MASMHSQSSSHYSEGTQMLSTRSMAMMSHRERKLQQSAETSIALEAFINSLRLDTFFQLSGEEQDERLASIDAVELFTALRDVNRELAMARLENHFLIDFLEKNDPKLLIGLQQRKSRQMSQAFTGRAQKDTTGLSIASSGGRTRGSLTKSVTMSTYTIYNQKKTAMDYKLNFRAKADMAEKTANEVEKRVHDIERAAAKEIKILRGHMEEIHYMYEETRETTKIFQLHFMRDDKDLAFLNTATEKQLERKIRKFVNNWLKNARALLSTMRLRITALHEHCQQLRNELLTKADLSGILTSVDFEKLMIKRTELVNALEEKNTHMAGLKGVTGKASLSMSEEKQVMMNIEEESKQLNNKTLDVIKTISKLEKEANQVELENDKDLETLNNLKEQLERYEAPSVHDYIGKKDEVLVLEKEEKMLKRKIYILEMKLDNTQRKCKRRTSSRTLPAEYIK
uniref:Cilia- and flagella-associated protein 263 n=1 Tax=Glossina pallidipes TaxID=7398 RepID=A0A1A9ZZF0_GLOPL